MENRCATSGLRQCPRVRRAQRAGGANLTQSCPHGLVLRMRGRAEATYDLRLDIDISGAPTVLAQRDFNCTNGGWWAKRLASRA